MTNDNYTTIYIDFSDEELALIDEHAAYMGEDRQTLLQRMLKEIIADIKAEQNTVK